MQELNDNQLREYLNTLLSSDDSFELAKIREMQESKEKKELSALREKASALLSEMEAYEKKKDRAGSVEEKIMVKRRSYGKLCRLASAMHTLARGLYEKVETSRVDSAYIPADILEIPFVVKDSKIHMEFPGRPAHRVRYEDKAASREDIREIMAKKNLYLSAVKKMIRNGRPISFDRKVLISITVFYEDERHLTDADNYDVKALIDALTAGFLIDDNPKMVAYMVNSEKSDKERTEVVIEEWRN